MIPLQPPCGAPASQTGMGHCQSHLFEPKGFRDAVIPAMGSSRQERCKPVGSESRGEPQRSSKGWNNSSNEDRLRELGVKKAPGKPHCCHPVLIGDI